MRDADLPAVVAFDQSRFGSARPAVIASYLADYRERAFVARNAADKVSGYVIVQDKLLGPGSLKPRTTPNASLCMH